jgi:hypothetical protein
MAQVQRLAAEVSTLRAAAAEAGVLREQVEHRQAAWQAAERRLADAQVGWEGMGLRADGLAG